jgi:hypothetical protein
LLSFSKKKKTFFFCLELEYYVNCVDLVDDPAEDDNAEVVIIEEKSIENNENNKFPVVSLEERIMMPRGFFCLVAEIQVGRVSW